MPIKISLEGSPSPSEMQPGYVVVATGVSTRTTGEAPPGEDPAVGGGAREPSPEAAGRGSHPRPLTRAPDTPGVTEQEIGPDGQGVVRADVHLVWHTGGIMFGAQPPGSDLHHDPGADLTRLSFSGVTLAIGDNDLGPRGWTSDHFNLRCTPGEGDQLLTAFLCKAGELPAHALASDAVYLACPGPPPGLWERLLRWIFG